MTTGPPNRRRRRLWLMPVFAALMLSLPAWATVALLAGAVGLATRKPPRESPARGPHARRRPGTASRSASTLPGARWSSQTSSCRLTV